METITPIGLRLSDTLLINMPANNEPAALRLWRAKRQKAGTQMDRSPSGTNVPTSVILARLVRDAPAGHVTLAWLMDHLRTRSFGIVLLLLGVCGLLPVLSPLAGLLLFIAAFQMIRAQAAPVFPRRIAERPIATDELSAMLLRIIPALHYLERFICPRWRTPFETTKRVIGVAVLLLGVCLLAPIPLSNIPIGLTVVLLAFAYLEEDGVLLAVAFVLFAAGAAILFSTVAAVGWLTKG
jgi:hypothetical protein